MGMSDTVIDYSGLFKDAEGNILKNFQTKSLDTCMHTYFINNGTLYKLCDTQRVHKINSTYIEYRQNYEKVDITATIVIYCSSDKVKPVYARSLYSSPAEHTPWNEFAVTVEDGKIVSTKIVQCDTRAALKKRLAKNGSDVLSDSSLTVKLAIEQWTKRLLEAL